MKAVDLNESGRLNYVAVCVAWLNLLEKRTWLLAREQGGGPAVRWGGVNPEGRKMASEDGFS